SSTSRTWRCVQARGWRTVWGIFMGMRLSMNSKLPIFLDDKLAIANGHFKHVGGDRRGLAILVAAEVNTHYLGRRIAVVNIGHCAPGISVAVPEKQSERLVIHTKGVNKMEEMFFPPQPEFDFGNCQTGRRNPQKVEQLCFAILRHLGDLAVLFLRFRDKY